MTKAIFCSLTLRVTVLFFLAAQHPEDTHVNPQRKERLPMWSVWYRLQNQGLTNPPQPSAHRWDPTPDGTSAILRTPRPLLMPEDNPFSIWPSFDTPDERPYRCNLCGLSFRESGALTRHMKSLTPCTEKIRFSQCKEILVDKDGVRKGAEYLLKLHLYPAKVSFRTHSFMLCGMWSRFKVVWYRHI